ncbi:LysR family transcriptional regulator [Spirosoma utsteinense]|uniref:DNA-binding transcriptional LysR family regulator n=1 Tax=Spirosoma utsteinense TaxID=2585773 RepID=A0ABR6W5W5_9BACT|nr:LysR family transcriptional regulator [Spirosoma utsteinense]MBC3785359.1 DNA-binding transcriptional LysR family regulator [Spirosoma utsteinense]MBC3791614.1 DNA-binding transcriptional LysR family regulator [Spirosoma utsteinense]
MLDFRLTVFYTVAKRLNFTKAAAELFVTQPAVTKHVQELENQFGTALFDRRGNQVSLTAAGSLLLRHAETIMGTYRQLEFDMNALKGEPGGTLRLGASTTVAQYVIPPVLARYHEHSAEVAISLLNGNTEQIEQALLNNDIDLGLVEGRTHHSDIRYTSFVKDELVLICRPDHPLAGRDEITLDELRTVPIVLRERGSGSLEVVEHALRGAGLRLTDLTIDMQLGSTESIKSYLSHSRCMAFISVFAVQNELSVGSFNVLDVQGLTIRRDLYSIQLQGISEGLADTFMRFARQHYNRR